MSVTAVTRQDIRLGFSRVRQTRLRKEPVSSTKIGLGPVLEYYGGDRVRMNGREFVVVAQSPRTGEIILKDKFGDVDRAWPAELVKVAR